MKVLLDSSTPVQARQAFANQEVFTVAQMGWGALEDVELLRQAESEKFDLLVLCEKNFQQLEAPGTRHLAILELWTNHRPTFEHLFPLIRLTADMIRPGEYRALAAPEA